MKDYRLNKTQLEHLREECLFAQGPIECENLKTFICGLYTNGFITGPQFHDFIKLIKEK